MLKAILLFIVMWWTYKAITRIFLPGFKIYRQVKGQQEAFMNEMRRQQQEQEGYQYGDTRITTDPAATASAKNSSAPKVGADDSEYIDYEEV